jgi:acetyl-CoA acetyltransferase
MTQGVYITGVGETEYVRGTESTLAEYAVRAAVATCRDAGVDPADVDGVIVAGFRGRIEDIAAGLRVRDLKFSSRIEMGGASSVAGIVHAMAAIESGRADQVLVTAVRFGYSLNRFSQGSDGVVADLTRFFPSADIRTQLEHPYGLLVPMQYYALQATRWLAEFGIGPNDMAPVALAMRANAQRNPRALMFGRPLTIEQYLASPLIVSPFRVLDCCLESDGAAALLVSARDSKPHLARHPVRIAAVAEAHPDEPDDVVSRSDILDIGLTKAAPRAFAEAGVGPKDLDFANLYDCFTYTVLRQLEELGFCPRGESPRFVREVGIGIEGQMPVNPNGGTMSEAHMLGMNNVLEAVRQIRGDAGPTQIERPRWGIATGFGDFGDGSVVVLTNQ